MFSSLAGTECAGWLLGDKKVWVGVRDEGASIVVCLSPKNQCGLLMYVSYPAPRWGGEGGEEEQ